MRVLQEFNYLDSYNAITGAVVAFLTLLLGKYWFICYFSSIKYYRLCDRIDKIKIN